MATAESVKAKLQGLIDVANATTGNADADLTAAVESLVNGYGNGGDAYLAMLNGTDVTNGDTLILPDGLVRVPTYMYDAGIAGVANIRTVIFPNSVRRIEAHAFRGIGTTSGGAYIRLNDGIEFVGGSAFVSAYCTFNCVPTSLVTIGWGAFYASKLVEGVAAFTQDINLPNVTTINGNAFRNRRFTGGNITIGRNIKTIGDKAFEFADSPTLTIIIDRAEDAISGAPWGATNATIVWTGDS